jgi:hypothetical protein
MNKYTETFQKRQTVIKNSLGLTITVSVAVPIISSTLFCGKNHKSNIYDCLVFSMVFYFCSE